MGLEVGDVMANVSLPVLDASDREKAERGQVGELSDFFFREQLAAGQNAPVGAQTLPCAAEQLLKRLFKINGQGIIFAI